MRSDPFGVGSLIRRGAALVLLLTACSGGNGNDTSRAGFGGFGGSGGSSGPGAAGNVGGGNAGSTTTPVEGQHDPSRCRTQNDGAEVLRSDLTGLGSLQVDDSFIHWLFIGGSVDSPTLRLYRLAQRPGAALEELMTDTAWPFGFTQQADTLWWASRAGATVPISDDRSTWRLNRFQKPGGPRETVLPDYVEGVLATPAGIVVARRDPPCQEFSCWQGRFELLDADGAPSALCRYEVMGAFSANRTEIVWAHYRAIEACTFDGAVRRIVATLDAADNGLRVDDTHAYWLPTFGQPGILRIPLQGGTPEPLLDATPVDNLLLEGDDIYFVSQSSIQRVSKRGGTPTVLVPQQYGVAKWALGPGYVYWMEGDPYEIMCLKRIGR